MHKPINKILSGLAFSPNLEANLYESLRLSRMFSSQLIFVHVGHETDEKKEKIYDILKKASCDNQDVQILFKSGDPVDVITTSCNEMEVDLLIIGAQQRENLFKHYLGSIARKLTHKVNCSVLLLLKQSMERDACKHIVVNGLEDPKTQHAIETAFYVSNQLSCPKITIVEEIRNKAVDVKVNDDRTLRKATLIKERIKTRENRRVNELIDHLDSDFTQGIQVKNQSIFGKTGYSIGHYAKVVRADLLVMNEPKRSNLFDRLFPHDMEYILSELPTNVLIVR